MIHRDIDENVEEQACWKSHNPDLHKRFMRFILERDQQTKPNKNMAVRGNDTNNIKMEKDSWLKFKPSEKSYPLRDERHLSEALLFITITCKNLKDGSLSSLTD